MLDIPALLAQCRTAGLGDEVDTLCLLAIEQRDKAIALAEACREYDKKRQKIVALASERGISFPPYLIAHDIANALA